MKNAIEKKIPDVNVGERVEVFHEGRVDFKMTGNVMRNDADICVVRRDDVPPAVQYIGNGVTAPAKRKEVPLNIYIFGSTENDPTGRTPDIKVNRI